MKCHKKLFRAKRILAILLAAVMGVSALPPRTVNASEVTTVIKEEVIDATIAETGNVTADITDQTAKMSDDVVDDTAMKTEIVVDLTADERTVVYTGESIRDNIVLLLNLMNGVHVYVDGVENTEARSELKSTWKQKQEDNEGEVECNPIDVGTYYLDITLEGKEGCYGDAKQRVEFTITPAPFIPSAAIAPIQPGTKAGDVSISDITAYCEQTDITLVYTEDDDSTPDVDESEESILSYNVQIKDAITGVVLEEDEPLVKGSDYVAELTLAFTDNASALNKSNYEFLPTTIDLIVSDLVATEMELEFTDTWPDGYEKIYDKEAVSLVKDTDYTVKVVRADNAGEISNPDLKAYWMDQAQNILDGAPTEAGYYLYVISYEPNDNVHLGCKKYLRVVIKPAELTLKPTVKQDTIVYPGTQAYEVLNQMDYQILDANDNDITDDLDKSKFWGTALYNGVSFPYVPSFTLLEVIGRENESSESVSYRVLDYYDVLEKGKSYCAVFTGCKCFYGIDGTTIGNVPVNSNLGDVNYIVNTSEENLLENAVTINLAEDFNAFIDVSAILKDTTGDSYDNPITKTYDTKLLYNRNADYKKAVAKASINGEGKNLAKDADSSLQYTWYRQIDETDGKPEWAEMEFLPENAGNYKLVVSYKDSQGIYYAAPAEVFYKIEKQKAKLVPVELDKEYTAWAGETVEQFINRAKSDCEIFTIQENGDDGNKLILNEDEYFISLQVEKEADETWSALQYSDIFEVEGTYRLTAELQSENYYSEATIIASEIMVKVMGTIELEVIVDESKLTSDHKTYDGEEFDISKSLENGLITVMTQLEEPQAVDAAELGLVYTWRDSGGNPVDAPVNADEYKYYVSFPGNTTYKAFEEVKVATFKIEKRSLYMEPVVKENIVAGPLMPSNMQNINDLNDLLGLYAKYTETKFNGVAEKDKDAFTYRNFYDEDLGCYHDGWSAFRYARVGGNGVYTGVLFLVADKDGNMLNSNSLFAGETEYYLFAMTSYANDWLAEPYRQNYTLYPVLKSFTTIRGNSEVTASVAINDVIEGMTHTVTAKEAIPYSYDVTNIEENERRNGNFVCVKINSPQEYYGIPETALFENSIKKAGAFDLFCDGELIFALFDASAVNKTEFDIRWEPGYTEHFILDFTGATLLPDLRKAVEPKSLAFNSPSTKMVVGETQQLDVKLTKEQISDTVILTYSVDNKEVLHVEEDGEVVALRKGSATVTVSPAYMVDGNLVPMEGAKNAKVKITVNDVTAPKIKKLTAIDTGCALEYTEAKNGDRYEFYVLEGKNKSVSDFEKAIASMKNYRWQGVFAIAPEYDLDNSTHWYLDDLKANTVYTVYIRNVTTEYIFEDGCKLTQSHAGTVKSFTTTKQTASELRLSFADKNSGFNEIYNIPYLTIPLSKGAASVNTEGLFYNAAGDESWETLPLSKALQRDYSNSKLVYEIYEMKESYEDTEDFVNYIYDYPNGKYIFIYTTSQASIDKKGKIKVKSVGDFIITVRDEYKNNFAFAKLQVTASPDSITGKNVKLKIGQSMSLSDMIVYKEGKKEVKGSFDKKLVMDEALLAAFENSTCFRLNGTTVTAVKAGKISFSVEDANISGKTATVTITATDVDPISNLKTKAVTDQYFDLEFTHSGYAEGFHITVTDARGSAIIDTYEAKENLYNEENGKYYYTVTGLTGKSKYNVSIAAIFEDTESKAVKKSVTTTLTPISYVSLDKESYGGVDIFLPATRSMIDNAYLISGNTYSLLLTGELVNDNAVYEETDSLTWTSSNKKVATVKAAKSSGLATLKALKAGTTTIEVKSKITKAVIARYEIEIRAVGNAYSYDENGGNGGNILYINSGVRVSVDRGEYSWVKFTAPQDGDYVFYSEGDDDSEGWFFWDRSIGDNASVTALDDNATYRNDDYDDRGGYTGVTDGCNFAKCIHLDEGQSIYIAVGHYDLSSSITTTVRVVMRQK